MHTIPNNIFFTMHNMLYYVQIFTNQTVPKHVQNGKTIKYLQKTGK